MEGKIITNERRFYPLLVSGAGLEQQTEQESEQAWDQLDSIPILNKKILLSASIIENLYGAEMKFKWEPYYSARLSYFLRELFFQNISKTEFYKATEALFIEKHKDQFNEILSYINNVILLSQPDPEEQEEEESEVDISLLKQLPLLDALGKFSNLGNQLITTENIKIKSQVAPVRPTLTNWLKNYRDELGIGLHDAVARAKFLFESQNTAKLPSAERERIHAIVRSLEDGEPLSIDREKQIIIFRNQVQQSTPEQKKVTESGEVPDIFERFQTPVTREDLKKVGTNTFLSAQSLSVTKDSAPDTQKVLEQIHNMNTQPALANAPAPKEEFVSPVSGTANEQLGTLRFSAKHVLPAERQEFQAAKIQPAPETSRISHFAPKNVAIPGEQRKFKAVINSTPSVAPAVTVPAEGIGKNNQNQSVPSVSKVSSPTIPVESFAQPVAPMPRTSVFRIKPNRE